MEKLGRIDPSIEARIRSSFNNQGLMKTIGATLTAVSPGEVRIEIPFADGFTQQHGYLHAGIITSIVDTACGYGAYTLMPEDSEVLTVEYKINFLSPARGEKFVAIGQVIKRGKTLTVCCGRVLAYCEGMEKIVATIQATMINVSK